MIAIRDVKYLYTDTKYGMECMDIITELRVPDTQYETIADAVRRSNRMVSNVRVLSFISI